MLKSNLKKKIETSNIYRPYILSRHPSHNLLRSKLPKLPFRSLIRLGSTTTPSDGKKRVEINSIKGIINSSNKLLMKECFNKAEVPTADWFTYSETVSDVPMFLDKQTKNLINITELPFPLLSKHVKGSRGTGNILHKDPVDLKNWLITKDNLKDYIFEKYYTYNREYRLHVTKNGCFYTCRKMLKSDTPKSKRFQRHDDNCVWYLENNPKFDKPLNWNEIVDNCVKALKELELDFCCFDIKVQSKADSEDNIRENPKYIIIESGSAPSFGELTLEKYLHILPLLILEKKLLYGT